MIEAGTSSETTDLLLEGKERKRHKHKERILLLRAFPKEWPLPLIKICGLALRMAISAASWRCGWRGRCSNGGGGEGGGPRTGEEKHKARMRGGAPRGEVAGPLRPWARTRSAGPAPIRAAAGPPRMKENGQALSAQSGARPLPRWPRAPCDYLGTSTMPNQPTQVGCQTKTGPPKPIASNRGQIIVGSYRPDV